MCDTTFRFFLNNDKQKSLATEVVHFEVHKQKIYCKTILGETHVIDNMKIVSGDLHHGQIILEPVAR